MALTNIHEGVDEITYIIYPRPCEFQPCTIVEDSNRCSVTSVLTHLDAHKCSSQRVGEPRKDNLIIGVIVHKILDFIDIIFG